MQTLVKWRRDNGIWDQRRRDQARFWFHEEVRVQLLARLRDDPAMRARLEAAEADVAAGRALSSVAAAAVVDPAFSSKT